MGILEDALNMEIDGERYYREQAAKNKGNSLNSVFSMLSDDERNHADIIRDRMRKLPFTSAAPAKAGRDVFAGLADLKEEILGAPEQLEAYSLALDIEKKSVELYEKLLSESEADRDMCEFLIAQEKGHYSIIYEITRLVIHPNVWVESAEFGRWGEGKY